MMRKSICFVIVIIIFVLASCKKESTVSKTDEASAEIEINIMDLFKNVDHIKEISTLTTEEYLYSVKDGTLIKELINLLESIEYTEVDNTSPEAEATDGPSSNRVHLQFYYKDGSKASIEYYYTDESDFAEYTSVTYNPYNINKKQYQVNDDLQYEIMELMYQGELLDLNAQNPE